MRIACLQTAEPISYWYKDPDAPGFDECLKAADASRERCFAMLERAGRGGCHLAVTIEGMNRVTSIFDARFNPLLAAERPGGALTQRLSDIARRYRMMIAAGLYTEQNGKLYNSLLFFDADGKPRDIYNKVHLPYGERGLFTAGNRYLAYPTEFGLIAPLICWDLQFPEAARTVALMGADLIVCPTMGWENLYGRCRAYENVVTIACAMGLEADGSLYEFADPSCVVDSAGAIVAAATRQGEQMVVCDIDIRKQAPMRYGLQNIPEDGSMRRVRMSQRRPDTYGLIVKENAYGVEV